MRIPRFLDTVRRDNLSAFHLQRLARIAEEDFGPVCAKIKADMLKQGVVVTDEWLRRGVLALQQYYAVALLDPLNQHAVSDAVDPFWHAHILHTKQYVAFCDAVTGGYIHHTPLDHADQVEVGNVAALYAYTWRCYEQFFTYIDGEFYPEMLPPERQVCKHMDVRCETVRANALRLFNGDLPRLAA